VKTILSMMMIAAAVCPVSAGVMDGAANFGFVPGGKIEAPAVTAPAKIYGDLRGQNEAKFCFEAAGDLSLIKEVGMPVKFCVSGLALERLPGGAMKLNLVSDNRALKPAKTSYVFENGALKYASVQVFDTYDEMYFGEIFVQAPVYPNGNLIPGAEVKIAARGAINPPSGELIYFNVSYGKPLPPPPPVTNGPCFTRAAQETADEVGMPVKFCLAGAMLVRKSDGGLELSVAGDLHGQFPAAYELKAGASYVRATIFSREEGYMSVTMGKIDLLFPVFPNGDVDPKGQALVDAVAGHNYDIYHSQWEYSAVAYKAGPAK